MKSKVLLCLSLCLVLWGCKESEPEPTSVNVTMHSSSQTLVEGEVPVELTIELDRTYKDLKYLYLAGVGSLLDRETSQYDGWVSVETGEEQLYLLRVPMPAGEKKRTLRLWVAKDEVYQGNSTYELKVYSYENEVVLPKTSLAIKYQDTTPKPVFGIFKDRELDVARTVKKDDLDYLNRFFLTIFADRSFTQTQQLTLTFSGTAEEGVHYKKETHVELSPGHYNRPWQGTSQLVLQIIPTAKFDPEKTIQIKLSAVEDGVIANGETYKWPVTGEVFTLENSFTLTVTE